jgi:SPX domain protein involved in polyphosphate accumulation
MNFTGFHKILKKHDKRLPNPCRAFYTARLHNQSWVRGDFSDVLVVMSRVYSSLRGDQEHEAVQDERQVRRGTYRTMFLHRSIRCCVCFVRVDCCARTEYTRVPVQIARSQFCCCTTQNFVRSTRKYWVHTENISSIKYHVLQHLPVFLQDTMAGQTDSQLVNSVYLDNTAMELYHGRLDKTPGAIALRFRWYGTGTPDVVFVERKTHRESWMGEVSVKERFTIKESQVQSLLNGTFDVDAEVQRMVKKGKSEQAINDWFELATEVIQAINSKQLVPTMRTQYMRTAFQIPFDATVRISLDTNLCMITERTKETLSGDRWFRDPNIAVPLTEITRFPHGVLEVKLQLQDENATPPWVQEMLDSGKLLEVHKFSKFIHGGAVLMPEDVRSVPYWIDDATLAESIRVSGAGHLLEKSTGANEYYKHLLPHDSEGKVKARVKPSKLEIEDSTTLSAAKSIQLQQQAQGEEQRSYQQRGATADVEAGADAGDRHTPGCWEECFEWTLPMAVHHVTGQKVGSPRLAVYTIFVITGHAFLFVILGGAQVVLRQRAHVYIVAAHGRHPGLDEHWRARLYQQRK